jgi:hypothetical protein
VIGLSMVEEEVASFQVEVECRLGHVVVAGVSGFGVGSKTLGAVDVTDSVGKLAVAMIDVKVLVVAEVDQAVVAQPAVTADAGVEDHDFHSKAALRLTHPGYSDAHRLWERIGSVPVELSKLHRLRGHAPGCDAPQEPAK